MNSTDGIGDTNLTVGATNNTMGDEYYVDSPISLALKAGMTSAYVVTFLVGFLGNAIGMYVVCRHTGFKLITNLLIANMAFADLLVCIFAMPVSVAHLFILNKWLPGGFGIFLCKMVNFSFYVSLAASVFTIVSISVERFVAVFFPLRCEFLKRPKVLTVAIWALSVLVMLPILFLFTVWKDPGGTYYCIVSWPWGEEEETFRVLEKFFIFIFVFLYCFPVLFLAFLYTLIARKLWVRAIPGNNTKGNRVTTHKCRKKVIKLLIFIVLLFTICWFPSHVMHYYLVYDTAAYFGLPHSVKFVSYFVSQANSSINPILYILLNDGFRKDFFRVIWNCLSRCKHGCCSVSRVFSHFKQRHAPRTSSTCTGQSTNRRMSLLQLLQAMRGTIGSAFSPNGRLTNVEEEQRKKISILHFRRTHETKF